MTEGLVDLLRSERSLVCAKAATHILLQEARIEQLAATNEELETENKGLRHMVLDQIEGASDDPEIMAASRAEWAARAKAAEAKLAYAKEALEAIVVDDTWGLEHDVYMMCRAALRKLTGGNDD